MTDDLKEIQARAVGRLYGPYCEEAFRKFRESNPQESVEKTIQKIRKQTTTATEQHYYEISNQRTNSP